MIAFFVDENRKILLGSSFFRLLHGIYSISSIKFGFYEPYKSEEIS